MDEAQIVRNRWRIVFELAIRDLQVRKMTETVSEEQVLDDVSFLQKRVDDLERDLADALSPASSRMGTLVKMEDGVLYYRINGLFVPISAVVAGLKFLNGLRKSGRPISKGMEKEEVEMFKIIEDAFDDLTEKKRPEEFNESENGEDEYEQDDDHN